MILMSDLVKDARYRAFLDREPPTPDYPKLEGFTPPWVVYVQREADGGWAKREFWKYRKALKFFYKAVLVAGVHDAAIGNKRVYTAPPSRLVRVKGKYGVGSDGVRRQLTRSVEWAPSAVLRAEQPTHIWCGYCRRPTIFAHFSRHPRLREVDPTKARCCLCGAAETIATPRFNRTRATAR